MLGFCQFCGFIFNTVFDPGLHEYSARYEETQGFSPTFNAFSRSLATHLIDQYNLYNKDIIEIGCGKGEFLTLLCELGQNRGVGFDPAYISERNDGKAKDQIVFIKDFYSEKYAHYQGDFVCCKMTLEHIPSTADFLDQVGFSVSKDRGTIIFFQVPDSLRILEECAYEDIYYEHCSYFCAGSLARLFQEHGLEVLKVGTEYDGQYLTIEARASSRTVTGNGYADKQLNDIRGYVKDFSSRYRDKVAKWQKLLSDRSEAGEKVVMWGSGSKGVSFLASLDRPEQIEYVVDINPFRQNHYMSGYGQKIVAPEFLQDYQPDLVIVMNRIYMDEIGKDLEKRGLRPELLAL